VNNKYKYNHSNGNTISVIHPFPDLFLSDVRFLFVGDGRKEESLG
jgi:hypothetical protein